MYTWICPRCNNTNLRLTVFAIADLDGKTGDIINAVPVWDENSECFCPKCGTRGKMKNFCIEMRR